MKRLWILLVLCCGLASAQKTQLGLVFENDLYTSTINDKYYTNGLEAYYRYLGKTPGESVVKRINEFRVGQYIYNPQTIQAADPNVHDRPFAGYLFGQFSKGWFYKNESVFKANTQIGVIGPSSGAEGMQKLFHNAFGYDPVHGWAYQIHETFAAQVGFSYSRKMAGSEHVDFHIKASGTAGTAYTGATAGVISRFSLKPLLPVFDSAYFGAAVNRDNQAYKNQSELFFFISPAVNYQLYDATIEGSLFNNDSPITFALIPWRLTGEAGFEYRKGRFNASYAFVYRGKEVSNWVNKGFFFGSIQISWLL